MTCQKSACRPCSARSHVYCSCLSPEDRQVVEVVAEHVPATTSRGAEINRCRRRRRRMVLYRRGVSKPSATPWRIPSRDAKTAHCYPAQLCFFVRKRGNRAGTRSLPATASSLLNRRAGDRSKGAEHAAIAVLRPQAGAATLAIVEELAGVRRHPLGRLVAAVWASDGGIEDHVRHLIRAARQLHAPCSACGVSGRSTA